MTDEQRRALARALGQPEDTTEARLHEVAAERAAATPTNPPTPTPPATPPATPQGDPPQAPQTDPPASDPQRPDQPQDPPSQPAPPQQTVPEGMVLVEAQMFETVRQGAEQGAAVAAEMRRQRRDETIRAAIGEGRLSPSRREHFERLWDRDPDGTLHLLTAEADQGGLAKGLVPVGPEIGASGDGEGAALADEGTGWFNFDEKGA